MAAVERDTRVIYKVRPARDEGDSRSDRQRRIPTALDPNDPLYVGDSLSRSKSRGTRGSTSTVDDSSTISRSTAYRDNVDVRRSNHDKSSYQSHPNRMTERMIVVDQRSERGSDSRRRPDTGYDDSHRDPRCYTPEKPLRGGREYYIDQSARREDGAIVLETGRGNFVEVIVPSRTSDEADKRGDSRYVYSNSVPQLQHKPVYDQDTSYTSSPKIREADEDWRLVESMRDYRLSTAQARGSRSENMDRHRARRQTQSSDDSFVLVTPEAPQEQPQLRSCLKQADYHPRELRRRRSRSISFRKSDVSEHDCGQRRHQSPGAEAADCGEYLRRRVPPEDEDSYSAFQATRTTRRQDDYRDSRYNERDDRYEEPYGPQRDHLPGRERSRRRREDRYEDDRSYYSDDRTSRYVKEKSYH